MAYRDHLSHDLTLPQFAEQHSRDNLQLLRTMDRLAGPPLVDAAVGGGGKPTSPLDAEGSGAGGGGPPTWLSSAILRPQGQPHQYVDGSLHLHATSESSASPVATSAGGSGVQWFRRVQVLQRGSGSDDEVPVSNDSIMASSAISANLSRSASRQSREMGEVERSGDASAAVVTAPEGTWQCAKYKADILGHPLYEQLLSAHVACLRIATPVDQLQRIDAQLEQSQQVVAKYSVLGSGTGTGNQMLVNEKELDQFMTHYVLLLCSFKEQLQQHVGVHAMEAVMACWELEQSLQSLTGVSPGEGTGATMSDDDDEHADNEINMSDGSFDGTDSMGFGPLIPTASERSLMERLRQELKHELKQDYKEKLVDIREEILRKRRAGKLPGDTTSTLKAWWQSHSKWPYPTEDDKARLVQETGLQLKQINNWFINQRKRKWHSNPSSSTALKSKLSQCCFVPLECKKK